MKIEASAVPLSAKTTCLMCELDALVAVSEEIVLYESKGLTEEFLGRTTHILASIGQ